MSMKQVKGLGIRNSFLHPVGIQINKPSVIAVFKFGSLKKYRPQNNSKAFHLNRKALCGIA